MATTLDLQQLLRGTRCTLVRIQPSGSVARYESRVGDNNHHPHVVCRFCGLIADVDRAVREAPCLTAPDASGFTIDEAEVIYWACAPTVAPRAIPDPLIP